MPPYPHKQLSSHGPSVFPLALGGAALSGTYGQPVDEAESLRTLCRAIDAGINLIDTADFYGSGHNEMLIGEAIRGRRDDVLLSVKFGALRDQHGRITGLDCRPAAIRNFVTYSLKRLKVEVIDIYRPARLDPQVPVEETVGAVADLIASGHVRYLGLSEVSAETVRRAHAVHPVTDLQIEYSLVSRGVERTIMPVLDELGIGLTAYGILSHGLLAGSRPADHRAGLPRFTGDNFARNRVLVDALAEIAREKGATTAQLATAWVASRGARVIPILGGRTVQQLQDGLGSLALALTADDLARIEAALPETAVAGTRYAEAQLRMLDSER